MSLFIVSAGHGLRDPGALNPRLGLIEHLESYQIAWHLRSVLESMGHSCEFITPFQKLSEKIAAVNRRAVDSTIAAAVEIHFNSAEAPEANGTEVCYLGAAAMASSVSSKLSAALGTKNRGGQKRDDLGWLTQTKVPALIVEVLFIQNDSEAKKVSELNFHQRAARAIAEGLTA